MKHLDITSAHQCVLYKLKKSKTDMRFENYLKNSNVSKQLSFTSIATVFKKNDGFDDFGPFLA